MRVHLRLACAFTVITGAGNVARAAGDGVLWYTGNNGSTSASYSTFEEQVTEAGASTFDVETTWPDSLDSYKLIVLVTPGRLFSPTAEDNLESFMAGGGIVALLGDSTGDTYVNVWNNLLSDLGYTSSFTSDSLDTTCSTTGAVADSHPMNECISAISYKGTSTLTAGTDAVTLFTGDSGQVLVAVEGSMVLFTDRDILTDSCTATEDNERFMRQLFEGLTDADGDADCDGEESLADGGLDCDDDNSDVNSTATDVCDGIDNDCNGTTDDDPSLGTTFYTDDDRDGFGVTTGSTVACEAPDGYADNTRDCDDADAGINPDADEYCDSVDNNCNGERDDNPVDGTLLYADDDGDSFGDDNDTLMSCEAEDDYVSVGGDCDDTLARVHPEADEYCNDTDDDCDGETDEDASNTSTWYADTDGDGYGDAESGVDSCDAPAGMISDSRDCDDTDPNVYPGAPGWSQACLPLDDGGTDTDGGGGDDEKSGCGCATSSGSSALAWTGALAALALGARRRRRA